MRREPAFSHFTDDGITEDPTEEAVYPGITNNPDADFDAQLDSMIATRQRRQRNLLLGSVVVLVLAVGAVGSYAALTTFNREEATPAPQLIADIAPMVKEEPTKSAEEAPEQSSENGETDTPKSVDPSPAPKSASSPKSPPNTPSNAPKPSTPSASALTGQGWNTVDRDPSKAVSLFEKALKLSPGNAEALYGLGYAQLKQGQQSAAVESLCRSVSQGNADLKREVQSLLANRGLSCS